MKINDLVPNDWNQWRNPSYFIKGMVVWARYPKRLGAVIECVVEVAAGDDAYIMNNNYNFKGWFNKWELLIKN